MLMAFPLYVSAQDEIEYVEESTIKVAKQTAKKYETRTVKGKVVSDVTGMPISGALVKASGINGYSTLTDDNGNYELQAPTFASSLYITAPDFGSVTLGLSNDEQQKDVRMLSAVFGDDYSENPNVMVDKVADNFSFSNTPNIKEDIQKQLGAYAHVTQRSGTPGIGSVIFMQGLNSINVNAQPLIVLDGAILEQQYDNQMLHSGFYNDILSSISTEDIASVEILRNGTALYGARGANGVIVITTRRSQSMATRITASVSAGVTFEPKYYDMMDAEQYRAYASELLKGTGTEITSFKFLNNDPNYYYYKQYHNNTDWKDMIYRSALVQNYNINVEGGDDVAKYNLSVGYLLHNSTLEYNDMGRMNIRFNTDINLTSDFDVRFDASFSNTTRNIRDDGAPSQYDEGTPTAPSFLAYVKAPFLSPYAYGNGQLSSTVLDTEEESWLDEVMANKKGYNYKLGNPAALNEYADAENKNRFENSILNISVTPKYRFNEHLSLSEHFSYTLVNTHNKYYLPVKGIPSYYVTSVSGERKNEVSSLASKQNSIQSDTRLTWKNRYGAHDISAFGGARLNLESFTHSAQLGYNTGSDKTPFMSSGLANASGNGYEKTWRTLDWYAQANYNYKGRYYVQANLTATGSSRFGKDVDAGVHAFDTHWGIFPSVQLGWVVSNESWFAKTNGINYLKLTAGYDVSGNDDIDIYSARSYFASSLYLNAISGLTITGIGNTEIKWETTKRFNAGFEMMAFDNRLAVGFNYFNSTTSDLLSLQSIGFLSGIQSNWANAGELKNEGFDASVSLKAIANKDFTWSIGATMGHYKNEITALPDNNKDILAKYYGANILTRVGQAANVFYGYATNGVYATTEEASADGLYIKDENGIDRHYFAAGDVKFRDIDGNKEINENDMVVIGDPNPDIYGNIFTSLTYKRFKLDINFNYSLGNDVYNYMRSQLEGGSRFLNQTTAMTQRWMIEGQQTDMPRITFDDPMGNSRFSDRWIEDGSYLRLKTVTLSYKLPMNSTFLQGLEFWVQGNNLFTFTNYLGTDPEFSSTSSVIGQGVDTGLLGQSRSVVAGVKINL